MATPEGQTPPTQAPPAMPTMQDAQAIFERAQAAAERAETAAGRMEQAQAGATAETQARFPEMPAEVVKQISDQAAKTVVEALNSQFELAAQQSQQAAGSGGASPPAGSDGQNAETAAASPPKRSIAQRILGD